MDQSYAPIPEETLVVPHPSTFGEVKILDRTDWRPADDAKPVPKSREMSVRCRMVEIETYDDYGEVVNSAPAVKHQGFDAKAKKWQTDVSVSELRADRFMTEKKQNGDIPGLKQRFGAAIAEYERYLVKEGRDLPIVLIADQVYPQAINALICRGVKTVQGLAGLSAGELATLKTALEKQKFDRMATLVAKFRDKAKQKLRDLGVAEAKPAAAKRPSREDASQQAAA